MEKKELLIKEIELENGLILKLYDRSRMIAGDRWLLSLIAKVEIFTDNVLLSEDDCKSGINPDDIKKELGDCVVFEQKRERNFVGHSVKDETFGSMCDLLTDSSVSYLSHADFPKKFVLKKLKEHMEKKSWYRT
ncbi:MAG: hypothetical protein GY749_06485 [Desulfobacteraceae bacterium]|nr:hypothetical protein [Desulfobacteraceae bacterium]